MMKADQSTTKTSCAKALMQGLPRSETSCGAEQLVQTVWVLPAVKLFGHLEPHFWQMKHVETMLNIVKSSIVDRWRWAILQGGASPSYKLIINPLTIDISLINH